MASQPFKRAFIRKVKDRGGWSVIFDRIASGETLAAIAKEYECSRSWLSRLLNEDEQRKALLQIAKREGASAYVEEALRLVDEAPVERDALQKAKLQADQRRYMASVYDREQFGNAVPGMDLTVNNFGELYLAMLRHREVSASPSFLPSEIAEDDDDPGSIKSLTGEK